MGTSDETQFAPFPLSGGADIAAATAELFLEIANNSGDPVVAASMIALNTHMTPIRAYEAAFISDLDAEYTALSACWKQRDLVGLKRLIGAYFLRRQTIVPKIVALINAPH